jgi:hypothetical protein
MVALDAVEVIAAVKWRHTAAVESVAAGLPGRCGSRMAVRKDTAKELGNEDDGMALSLSAVDPL